MATETPRKFDQDEYTHQPHPDQRPEEHEHSDVKIRPLVIFIIFFAGVTAATLVGMRLMMAFFKAEANRDPGNQRQSLVAAQPARLASEVPLLQGVPGPVDQPRFHANTPAQDMKAWGERNKRLMEQGDPTTGAWPIELAMKASIDKDLYKADLQAARIAASQPATTRPAQSQPAAATSTEGGDGR
jgi:hypothetical protein